MGLYPDIILSKQEKYRRLYDDISTFVNYQSFFKGVYPNLQARLNEKQIKTLEYLRELYFNRSFDRNDPDYDKHNELAISFLKEILSLIEKPITFSNGYEMEPFEKRYSFIHNPEHDGSHLGSNFRTLTPKGEAIRKLHKKDHEIIYGHVQTYKRFYYDVPDWLKDMGVGYYLIDGYRFDLIGRSYNGTSFTEIKIYYKDIDHHPILAYIKRNDNPIEELEPVSCTACGDGGCPYCEPSRFI